MILVPILLALLGLGNHGLAPRDDSLLEVDDFACIDHSGTFQRLSRHADARFVVLYSFLNDCPIVRQDAAELRELQRDFAQKGVRFLGLDSAPQDDRASVALQVAELELQLPILLDATQCVAEMLGVNRSGEALVIATESWTLLWRGPIDDRLDYGAQKEEASREFLREALTAVLAGEEPPSDSPAAKGCAITFVAAREKHAVEYVRDVAPILQRRCVSCHKEGGIGPWSMSGYEKVRGWSAMMSDVLLTARMPPWYADPEYGSFVEDIGVSPEEIRTIVHWADSGMARGQGEDPLAIELEAGPEWPLGPPDMIVELPEQTIPATGRLSYKHVTVALDLPEGRWVRALDLRPSNPVVLHHAFGFVLGQQEMNTLRDEVDEFPKFVKEQAKAWLAEHGDDPDAELPPGALDFLRRRSFLGRTYFARYFPGTRSSGQREGGKRRLLDDFPEGTGKFLMANPEIFFELHYTTYGVATTDRPSLGIYFHDEKPERELKVTSVYTRKIKLEPNQRGIEFTVEKTFPRDFTVYAVSPHMHYRGRSMRYTAILPDGSEEVLLSVVEYVFDWQANYTLVEPRDFPAGTRIVCEAVYDNSPWNEYNPDPNKFVRFGPRTEDEMFVAYIIYAER